MFLLFLCLGLLVSCGDSTDDEDTPNILRGVWDSYYSDTDSLVLTRVFTYNHYSYFSFADGKSQDQLNRKSYRIKDNLILLESYTQKFKIDMDTLWITNSKEDQITKYIKNKNSNTALEGDQMD